ncbi:uncharacterized protein B0P05DRAFT_526928 [Gilbertella persicaria]|uniref:Uncharacterized protein n=1 Tax=Rhizopus stolonifer TaxID=4846 RepID=A0A367KSI3_RHIST|nr:uncharacterized protein B0P05DRAFT_526928 [Gilbertella persicaria]KAI8091304.1 hypothetical protein B0P05DRAFT_526928 [Gilbertella persicaria]RCI05151.1 hypothetical protein CU098_010923 [Rhizopus stolonifer]
MRDIIQLEFPDYKDGNSVPTKITERVQKLIMASTRLCSVVAANEDWASCVENDLIKMIESYRKCCKLPPHMLDGLVDLEPQKVYSDIDQAHQKAQHRSCTKKEQQEVKTAPKKRKMAAMTTDGLSAMIPSCTMYVRSQPLRSLSEPSSQPSRRTFNDLITAVPQPTTAPFGHVFNLASPISPSSSSIHQRLEFAGYSKHESMLQSPPIPDSMMVNNHYSTTARAFSVQNNAYSYPTTTTTTKKTTATATATASTTTTAIMASATASAAQGNNMQFNFDTTSYSQQPVVIPPRQSPNSHYNNMYYPQTNFQQQQRMIMQQDYEQRQLLENNSNVHLPIIRNHFYQPSAQQGHSAQSWS